MMIANYHTHTWRCGHASGDDERVYVEAAIAAGFRELGFADHAPMPVPDGFDPAECSGIMGMRMKVEETEDYVKKVLSLRDEYKNDIKIHLGFEVEYLPEAFDGFLSFINTFPIDYLILGQHTESVRSGMWFSSPKNAPERIELYSRLVCEGIKTGKFTYVAHPDLCNYQGSLDIYEREMKRIIETAKEYGVPLEINLLGINTHRNYPSRAFWAIAGDVGCDVIIGSDAHSPEQMKPQRALYYAQKIVEHNPGLNLLDTVSFKQLK